MTPTSPDTFRRPEARRWPIATAAVAIQACLGSAYAWSVFRTPLQDGFGWSYEQTATPFRFFLMAYAAGLTVGGVLLDRFGPGRVTKGAGVVLIVAFLLAAWTGCSPASITVFYGLLGGLANGTAYATPIATVLRWFPEKKGLMGGMAVMGFGAGALIFAPAISMALGSTPADYAERMPWVLTGMGLLLGTVALVAGSIFRWPEGEAKAGGERLWGRGPGTTVRTWPFPAIWVAFVCSTSVGLVVINEASPLIERLSTSGGAWLGPAAAVGALSVANGLGRIFWGYVSDKAGRRVAFPALFATMFAGAMLLFLAEEANLAILGFLPVGLCFGGMFGMLPATISSLFGNKHFGANYGLTYTAYMASAFFAPLWSSSVIADALRQGEVLTGQRNVFAVLAGLCVLGALCGFALRDGTRQMADR